MAKKTYFEELQEQAAAAMAAATSRGPELTTGPQQFTILGGTHGTKDGRDWSAVVLRHTNGHEYRIFYDLYWPLKEGELEQRLNVNAFNWICAFNKDLLASYTDSDFDNYFNALAGKQFELQYTVTKKGKVVVDFSKNPIPLDVLEETLVVDEINFDEVE